MTRQHETTLEAIARASTDDRIELASPLPARFRRAVELGDVVRPGTRLGDLELLGRTIAVLAPATASGAVVVVDAGERRPAVAYGATLVVLDPAGAATSATAATSSTARAAATGLVFRAPTSGRFYGRPSPDKPAFVSVGDELSAGATVCLLEVMKTFHRVTYGGAGLPERARVRELLVADGADVTAGDPLLALED